MPDMFLTGNGEDCPACALRRNELRAARAMEQSVACNQCNGIGRIERPIEVIIAEAVLWAEDHYWRERAQPEPLGHKLAER